MTNCITGNCGYTIHHSEGNIASKREKNRNVPLGELSVGKKGNSTTGGAMVLP